MRPSTPASTALSAAFKVGTTWKTVSPAAFRVAVYFVGSPADVVTIFTPWSMRKSTMPGSRTKAWATLTAKGLSVISRMSAISSRMMSSSPDEVSITPSPPALDTALASVLRAIQPMGACTMG